MFGRRCTGIFSNYQHKSTVGGIQRKSGNVNPYYLDNDIECLVEDVWPTTPQRNYTLK